MAEISKFSFEKSPSGTLSGESLVRQTEDIINALGEEVSNVVIDTATLTVQVQQAIATANTAQSTASAALASAQNALQQLDTLTVTVNTYDQKITQAVSQSASAVQTANSAQTAALGAQAAAQASQASAESAQSLAQQAQTAASSSQQQAEAAQDAAETAQAQASNASALALNAQQQAQSAQQSAQIAAGSAEAFAQNAVQLTPQDLSEEQQAQARTNIGAASSLDPEFTGNMSVENLLVSGSSTLRAVTATTVTATQGFTGDLNGTSARAVADDQGNNIADTYATQSNTYTKAQVDAKVSSVYRYKGTVATIEDLPTSNNTVGDVYNVESTGGSYVWTGTQWDTLYESVDLSQYLTIASAQSTYFPKSGGTLTGALILKADPTTALGAATKQYVDNAVSSGPGSAVLFTAQALSTTQQSQARTNIGALGKTEKASSSTSADKFSANRTISLTGDVTGSVSSNFSGNVSIATTYTVMGGATASEGGSAGAVPAPAAGENDEFLRGDGTWQPAPNNMVLQTASSANGNYPILLKETTGTSTTTDGSIFDANVYVNPSTGKLTANGFVGPVTGNADTASKLATARTITLAGDATGSFSFDGSANKTLTLTIANASVTNAMLAASSVTFSKVSSGDVATQAEAEAGTVNNVFMTPLRVAQAIAAISGNVAFNVFPNYSSFVEVNAPIDGAAYTPTENGWLRGVCSRADGDYRGFTVYLGSNNSGTMISQFYQNRYPGSGVVWIPVYAGQTYFVSSTTNSGVYFHKPRG